MERPWKKNIVSTCFKETAGVNGNATLNQIGYLSGNNMI